MIPFLMNYEPIDISGDAGIRAWGGSLEELFKNSALGMYSLITDLEGVKEKKELTVSVESGSLEGLLVGWLNELIFQFDTYGFTGKTIEIKKLSESEIEAAITGEDFDTSRHERRLLIKAATYHNLKIVNKDGVFQAEIIFDI